MKKKIILTKGLPASGKSTWAKQYIRDNNTNFVRINNDDLRAMLHCSQFSHNKEKMITRIRKLLMRDALEHKKSIIVDNTNLHPKHEIYAQELAKEFNAIVEIKDFTHVSLQDCITRDLNRTASVGEKVIKQMHKQFLCKPIKNELNPNLPTCVMIDLDGTLCHSNGERGPYEWDKVQFDKADKAVLNSVKSFEARDDIEIIIFTARPEDARENTELWLNNHNITYSRLIMKASGDNRKDTIAKSEMYLNNIKDVYNVEVVYEDRNRVVDMWRNEFGLKVFQPQEGL
jgi:predicted kinase